MQKMTFLILWKLQITASAQLWNLYLTGYLTSRLGSSWDRSQTGTTLKFWIISQMAYELYPSLIAYEVWILEAKLLPMLEVRLSESVRGSDFRRNSGKIR